MRTRLVGLITLSFAGCFCGETTITLDPPQGPIAVTAEWGLSLNSRRCSEFPFDNRGNLKPSVSCTTDGLPVDAVSVDDPRLVEVGLAQSSIRLKALAPGTTTVRAQAGGTSYAAEVETRMVNRVQARLDCDDGADGPDGGTPAGAVFPAGATFNVWTTSFSGDTPLLGVPAEPLRCDVATSRPTTPPSFVAGAVAARGSITSSFDPTLSIPVRVFTAAEITVDMPDPVSDSRSGLFRTFVLVDGKRPCLDDFTRRVENLTPEVCHFGSTPDAGTLVQEFKGPLAVPVRRVSAGVCTVRIAWPDRPDLTAQRSLTF